MITTETLPLCSSCGKAVGCDGDCPRIYKRHLQCESCSAVAYPHPCLSCLREEVAADGYVVVKTRYGVASWWRGACCYPPCTRHDSHEHYVGGWSTVVERLAA